MPKQLLKIWILPFLLMCTFQSNAQVSTERSDWFVNDRFGMFIHWGVYSGAEGYWHGEKLRYDNDYAEWIQYRNRIEKNDYLSLLDRFQWDDINPEEWVLLAKRAGMKYVTITAKHHDGFALWNSMVNNYNVTFKTNGKRDIIKELSDACDKHGLKLGLYYSHWVDWEHEFGWDHTKELSGITDEQYNQYWQEKVMPQMRELLSNYGAIGLIWFDMWIHHSETVVAKEQLVQLKNLIRELQPDCLINSRLGLSVEEDSDVDFRTMGDNQLGTQKLNYPWQTSGTVAHSWGFHATENQWKSTTSLLKALINNVSLNGNFMLNIGPRANGEVPYEIESRLNEIGDWLLKNGESIYHSEAFELKSDIHDWGRITKKVENGKTKLYLQVFNWPLDKQLRVTGIKTKPARIYLLENKEQSIPFEHNKVITRIQLPKKAPDPRVSVVVMEFDETPEVHHELVGESIAGGYALTPFNLKNKSDTLNHVKATRFGSVPSHLGLNNGAELDWEFYIDKQGKYKIAVSYSYQGEKKESFLNFKLSNATMNHKVQYTGKTVGEPKSDWVIDSFNTFNIGEIEIVKEGFHTLNLAAKINGDPLRLNSIWVEKINKN